MAYINQDQKKVIAAALKVALKDYPTLKYTLSIHNHSTISFNAKKGPKSLDPEGKGSLTVNHYYIDTQWSGEAATILKKINECMHTGHWDESDSQSDYFHCAFYVQINIGSWDKPYVAV